MMTVSVTDPNFKIRIRLEIISLQTVISSRRVVPFRFLKGTQKERASS